MIRLLRGERFPAILLLVAAAIGLVLANAPVGPSVIAASEAHLGPLTLVHWVSDFLLALFFFGAAVELQYELTSGELNSLKRALRPMIAAAGGVVTPIIVYLVIAGRGETASGWPVPTATDIAFALGVLAVFGRGLPSAVRVFLLALAIIDDIIGVVFIAVLFTDHVDLRSLGAAILFVVVFGVLSRLSFRPRGALMVVAALAAWWFVHASGVHATIAGVLLGLAVRQHEGLRARTALEAWINGLVLPLFAFCAALIVIPRVPLGQLSLAFWGIAVALPVGKVVGITLLGWLTMRGAPSAIRLPDLVAAACLGGIGFTVSLLLANLAFASDAALRDQAVLGVLAGSAVSLVLAAITVSLRASTHRRETSSPT
ncbi:MAG: Na+/H+ antiporter NhaA [Microbacterium sp.]